MNKNDRANFGSKLGVILASAGSAVGLGNIWRFPYETGNHGGAAFIIIYLGCILLLGLPIMISEFLIGRHSRANTAAAYQILAPKTHWRWVGRMGVLAGLLILSYYSVVAGWTLEYITEALTNSFSGKSSADFIASFQQNIDRQIALRNPVDAFNHGVDAAHKMSRNQHGQQKAEGDGKHANHDRGASRRRQHRLIAAAVHGDFDDPDRLA